MTQHVDAGREFGEGVIKLAFWLCTNRWVSYLWFWLLFFAGAMTAGQLVGITDWMKDEPSVPDWYLAVSVLGAIPLIVYFRRQIPKVMPWLLGGGIAAAIGYAALS
jgi:hypothetical protein